VHNDRDVGRGARPVIAMQGPTTIAYNPFSNAADSAKDFTFDYSYWSHDGFVEDINNGYRRPVEGSNYADQVWFGLDCV
jgi:kinesin family protein 1